MDLARAINQYLDYCQFQKRLSGKTVKAYKIDLMQFTAFVADCGEPFHKEKISQYVRDLHLMYKPKTVKRKIASVRAFINYLEFEEMIDSNPVRKMRLGFREPVALPKSLSLKTVRKLFSTANMLLSAESTKFRRGIRLRNMAVLELLFATGLRVSELCSLHSADVNLQNGMVKVWGKGSRERIVFVGNAEVLAVLREYERAQARDTKQSGWFFTNRFGNRLSEQSVRDMVKSYAAKAGIAGRVTPHMLRHTFATLLLEEDVDIRYIQNILG
ncbi:MAG: tyrosine-type recombinase/integrase, partial [Clostridiales Family XIII bacterium]|nr:tyrosine-type recombinase/integrase [Clostridiales Family XIII bacterium]